VLSSQRGHRDLTTQSLKRLLRITDRLVDAVVVNCEAMRRYLVDEERVPEGKVRLCYNAVDVATYRRWPQENPSGKPVIGTVCALRPEKGLDTLIRAFATLHDLGAKLVIVGSGSEEASLKALCAELGVADACHFQPATTQVAEWLNKMDIFVLPSRSEALSNALMEAMACACCPVASRVGGNPELIDPGQNGMLFQADNVRELSGILRDLLGDEARRKRLGAAASDKMAARFTYAQAAATMESIYEAELEKRKNRRA
jgi:glycosyltransferase involved in cell wall biosynthesis